MSDFVPPPDAAFNNWQYQLVDALGNHATAWGIPATAVTELQNQRGNWDEAYSWVQDPATKTKPRVLAKNEARKEYVAFLRAFLKQYITYNPAVSDEDRVNMQLPVHKKKPTPVPPPSTMPVGKVDISVHRRHTIRVRDSVHTGRGKPPGVYGVEVWRKIGGTPPVSDEEFVYAKFSSSVTFTLDYSLEDVGKTVWYQFRWVNMKNDPGPWSENIVFAVIGY